MHKLQTDFDIVKPKDDTDDDNLAVERSGSRIFFYSEVTRDSVLLLNKHLIDLSARLMTLAFSHEIEVPPILLHINSHGGSLLDAFAAVDYIKNCRTPVHSIIDGNAASAATIMSVVAKKRYIHKHSYMLIHQLSSNMYGKFEEQIDDFHNAKIFMDRIYEIYTQHTKIPTKTLKEILKRDIYFDAKTCIKYGLADQIIGE